MPLDGHRTAERRSVAYHRAIAERIAADPSIVERARQRLATSAIHPRWVARWEAVLALPIDELCARLVEDSEQMIDLRQVSPFVGVLDAKTRWAIWRRAGM